MPLQRRYSIPLTYMIFDVLSIEGDTTASQPYSERRLILEDLNGPLADVAAVRRWRGGVECLFAPMSSEGVVAKPRRGRYVAGERGWIKMKGRDYWRYVGPPASNRWRLCLKRA